MLTSPLRFAQPSSEGFCIAEKDMPKFKGAKPKRFDVRHDALGIIGTADVVPVCFSGSDRMFMADKGTGTLYDAQTLRAMTGNPLELIECK